MSFRHRSAAVLLLGAIACGGSLSQRHEGPEDSEVEIEPIDDRVTLSLQALEIQDAQPVKKSVFDLTREGQAAFVTKLPAAPDEFLRLIRSELSLPSTNAAVARHYLVKRRVVANLIHRPFDADLFYPADRIAWAEIKIAPSQGAIFRSYDKVDTGYEVIDIGKLTRTATHSLTAAAEVGSAHESAVTDETASSKDSATNKASLSATLSNSRNAARAFRRRFGSLAVEVGADGTLSIFREGMTGIDLTGAVAIDVTVEAPARTQQAHQLSLESSKLKVVRGVLAYPQHECLPLSASGTAYIRRVKQHGKTIEESDDNITYAKQDLPTVGAIIRWTPTTLLGLSTGSGIVRIRHRASEETLVFESWSAAREGLHLLRSWLQGPAGGDSSEPVV